MDKSTEPAAPSRREAIAKFFDVRHGRASFTQIRHRIDDESQLDGIHAIMLAIAMVIACVGLNTDSTEAVIGAMLICPLMGSVVAIAYGVATLDGVRVRKSIMQLLTQMGVCIATSTVYFILTPMTTTTMEIISNSSPMFWEIILGLAGGIAGGIGLTRKGNTGTLLAGVAVATSLMPPLCTVGFGIAILDFGLAVSALYKFLINVIFIMLGVEIVMTAVHVPARLDRNRDGVITQEERDRVASDRRRLRRWFAVALVAFAIPCILITHSFVSRINEPMGEYTTVVDSFETRPVSDELRLVFPEIKSYSAGVQGTYDPEREIIDQKVVAIVTCDPMLNAEDQERVTNLVKGIAQDVNEVEFVDASQLDPKADTPEAATTAPAQAEQGDKSEQ